MDGFLKEKYQEVVYRSFFSSIDKREIVVYNEVDEERGINIRHKEMRK